jgi:hypothetical protein
MILSSFAIIEMYLVYWIIAVYLSANSTTKLGFMALGVYGFRVWGSRGLGVALGFRDLGFRVQGSGFRV